MGLGVFLYGFAEVGLFYHAGENLGYTSWMQASARRGYGAVVMMNSSLAGDPTRCEGECALMEEIMGSLALVYDWPCARWGVGVASCGPDSEGYGLARSRGLCLQRSRERRSRIQENRRHSPMV